MPSTARITSNDQIIRVYTAADFENRLSMFLEHRELRDQFVEIDNQELKIAARTSTVPGDQSRKTIVGWLRAALAGCCATT